ncbi:sigma-70 family RNA polymerase sigma factor [Fulvivirgaceae bacterium BMA10]|uniref:Sigma-70 family RNA polymerase sigma factor n=1 Tax=Splendidivirga corallicola TaxID=3051826 RepID=A0ABT8KTX9_9BACT|nr:sigma-70 family RNA polymerase sigma factor [Fulvivirgaceae bacterium BMA10]
MKDKEYFLEQVFSHQAIIHKICRMYRDTREDQEDLFQEIVYQLWKSFGQFQGKSKFSTWMYRIGLNTAMATFRKPKTQQLSLEDHLQLNRAIVQEPEDENSERLFRAIRKLEEADRALLSLYFEDLSYAEVGEVLGISENNVGVRLTRIKGKLRKLLKV